MHGSASCPRLAKTVYLLPKAQVPMRTEERMLELLSDYDDAYFSMDAVALQALLAEDVTICRPPHNRGGPARARRVHARVFFANYHFKHHPVVRAVNAEHRTGFCLWDDEAVLMRAEKFDEQLPASGSHASVSGIWKLRFNEAGKVQDIFLRQFTREEKKHRLKLRPSQTYVDFRATSLVGPELELSDAQVARMEDVAQRFNEVWRTGDVSIVHDYFSSTARTINPIFGEEKNSREEWESMISSIFQYWDVKENSVDIAVTLNSNKAFMHWTVKGVQKDTRQDNTIYGLNLLVFDPAEGKITEVVGFRQPLASEHEHIMKAGPYSDKLGEE